MNQQPTFEEAYSRLEFILDKLNTGELSLEDSLKFFEEADSLIRFCSNKLDTAEQKIQTLVKNRTGDLSLNNDGNPQVQEFETQNTQILASEAQR